MTALTIQQRNLLNLLLTANDPLAIAELADKTNLSARQVRYRLKPVKAWLAQYGIELKATPGVGMVIDCSAEQRQRLQHELNAQSDFQLVLSAGQRQQLFAFHLLTHDEPLILNWFQHAAEVSRTTALKDLDPLENWLRSFGLELVRRPNYGIEVEGYELARRQALTALLWGDAPFEKPLMSMVHGRGLTFLLAGNASLPIVKRTNQLLHKLDTQAAFNWVAQAEDQLGGRFTDDAVLHLALALAIQDFRLRAGRILVCREKEIGWLQGQKVWAVAAALAKTIWFDLAGEPVVAEVAGIAVHLLAGLRDHMWPGDLEIDVTLTELIDVLMAEVAMAFATPALRHDTPLRDGLVTHIIPAFMRQRFGLWAPPAWSDGTLSRSYRREHEIAQELGRLVTDRTGVILPPADIDILTLLLRAAFIRESSSRPKRVYIICPSGMATAQLLVARLKARFPSLEILGALSLRELTLDRVAGAHLLISTVPVQRPPRGPQVIQVHPLLLPEDVEKITQWLTTT